MNINKKLRKIGKDLQEVAYEIVAMGPTPPKESKGSYVLVHAGNKKLRAKLVDVPTKGERKYDKLSYGNKDTWVVEFETKYVGGIAVWDGYQWTLSPYREDVWDPDE